jgi:hypothetical protein
MRMNTVCAAGDEAERSLIDAGDDVKRSSTKVAGKY